MKVTKTECWWHRFWGIVAYAWLGFAVTGCSNSESPKTDTETSHQPLAIARDTATGGLHDAWEAVQTPLVDVNIKRQPIPEKLQLIMPNPYASPVSMDCKTIGAEITELDGLLGRDVDAPNLASGSRKDEYIEKGSSLAREQAAGMAYDQVNVIPYRGVVRQISGASKYAKKVARAYEAGNLRRAYLKGLGAALGCMHAP